MKNKNIIVLGIDPGMNNTGWGVIEGKNMNFKQKTDLYYRIKRLLDHKEMGELFKVLLAFKNVKNSFAGFN